MKALHAKGTPGGMALGNATGDGLWCNWLIWAFGGKLVDEKNRVVIDSPEDDPRRVAPLPNLDHHVRVGQHARELVGCRARPVDVPSGDLNLHLRLEERRPTEVIRKAVKGMLPRNKLARQQITKLKVYAGPEHPHVAQAPQPFPLED